MKTKTRNLRRIVSIMLCVIISCICLVTPSYAVNTESTDIFYTHGVKQITMYPAVFNENGVMEGYYSNAGSSSEYYPYGNTLVNLTVSDYSKFVYNNYNCGGWYFVISYTANSDNMYLDINLNNELYKTVYTKTDGSVAYIIPDSYSYFTYELTWHFTDGATFVSGGHVNN